MSMNLSNVVDMSGPIFHQNEVGDRFRLGHALGLLEHMRDFSLFRSTINLHTPELVMVYRRVQCLENFTLFFQLSLS